MKLIAYLGLGKKKEATLELRKALRTMKSAVFVKATCKLCPTYISIRKPAQ
jgi:hypothetical protein